MGSLRKTIHLIHEHEEYTVPWYLVEQRPLEYFLLRISYDHTGPTLHMKIIVFPSHPTINNILKLQKINLLEMKNTTNSPRNSTTKTN